MKSFFLFLPFIFCVIKADDLQCFNCEGATAEQCSKVETPETCSADEAFCRTTSTDSIITKGCASECTPGGVEEGTLTACCESNLCNLNVNPAPSNSLECFVCDGGTRTCTNPESVQQCSNDDKYCKTLVLNGLGGPTYTKSCAKVCVPSGSGPTQTYCCEGSRCNGAVSVVSSKNIVFTIVIFFVAFWA